MSGHGLPPIAGGASRGVTTVAIVIPAREAAALLSGCLAAIGQQSRAADEVWLVVGRSTDGTLEIARGLEDDTVRVLENAAGDRATAMNLAVATSSADVFAMVDAQARLAPTYISSALVALEASGAAVVGGPMRPVGRTAVGRALALALRSPFGIGDSQFHFAGPAHSADSVYLGVYRASVFTRVGQYNPALQRTEDDDLNFRVRAAGFDIWLDPGIRSTYLCRGTLGAIWQQYVGYGYWKVALATLRPRAVRFRHVVPAAFVVALVVTGVASATLWLPALPIVLITYLLVAAFAGILSEGRPRSWLLFPVVTMTMHLAYGVGTLAGLLSWQRLARAARRGAAA